MSQLISSIFGAISGPTGQKIGGLAGMGSNILQQIMLWRAMSQAGSQQQQLAKLLANPSLLTARAASAAQPLNQALTRTVTDQTLANLATRGLNPQTAPGQTQEAVAEATAPYAQQNLNSAAQMIAATLGLPFDSAMQLANMWSGGGTDLSAIWANLSKGGFTPSVGGVPDPALGTISAIPSTGGGTPAPDMPPPDISFPPAAFPNLAGSTQFPNPSAPPNAMPDFWNDAWMASPAGAG